MSVENTNPAYEIFRPQWARCRDTAQGQDAIYRQGEKYLPRLDGQTDEQYLSYKLRARYLNAMQRTVDGLTGLVVRKDPIVTGDYEDFLVDTSGTTIEKYMLDLLSEILTVGRGGTLVDFPESQGQITVAQSEAMGMSPTWSYYSAEDIINWKTNTENSRVYTLVVLREFVHVDTGDEFETDLAEQYRVLDLDPESGSYRVRIFNDAGSVISESFPMANGGHMDYIPFVIHGDFRPPMLDVADTNLHHYQLSADLYHGLHFVALPTPWVTGVDIEQAPNTIGPQKLWVLENPDAQVGLLEFQGQGLDAISAEIAAAEKSMAQLGARMLSDMPSGGGETATAASIRSSAETSTLGNIVSDLNQDFALIVSITNLWMGGPESSDAEVKYNTDFFPRGMDSQTLGSLVSAWQQGAITLVTLIENLQAGEIVGGDQTPEEYADDLSGELPPTMQNQISFQEQTSDDSNNSEE